MLAVSEVASTGDPSSCTLDVERRVGGGSPTACRVGPILTDRNLVLSPAISPESKRGRR